MAVGMVVNWGNAMMSKAGPRVIGVAGLYRKWLLVGLGNGGLRYGQDGQFLWASASCTNDEKLAG